MSDKEANATIKCVCDSDIRVIKVPRTVHHEALISKLTDEFGFPVAILKYEDQEGDVITLGDKPIVDLPEQLNYSAKSSRLYDLKVFLKAVPKRKSRGSEQEAASGGSSVSSALSQSLALTASSRPRITVSGRRKSSVSKDRPAVSFDDQSPSPPPVLSTSVSKKMNRAASSADVKRMKLEAATSDGRRRSTEGKGPGSYSSPKLLPTAFERRMSHDEAQVRRGSTGSIQVEDGDDVALRMAVLEYQQLYSNQQQQGAPRKEVPVQQMPVQAPGSPKTSRTPAFLLKKPPVIDVNKKSEVDLEPNALQRTPSKASPLSPFTPSFREGDPSAFDFGYNTLTISPTYDLPSDQVPEFLRNPFPQNDGPANAGAPRMPSPGSPQFAHDRDRPAWQRDDEGLSDEDEEEPIHRPATAPTKRKHSTSSMKSESSSGEKKKKHKRRSDGEKKKRKEVTSATPVHAVDGEKSPSAKKKKKRTSIGQDGHPIVSDAEVQPSATIFHPPQRTSPQHKRQSFSTQQSSPSNGGFPHDLTISGPAPPLPVIDNSAPFPWKKGMLLGRGGFGAVYQGLTATGQMIAVKHLEMSPDANPDKNAHFQTFKKEIDLLKRFKHSNIVQYYGSQIDKNNVYVFLEFVPGGSIQSLLGKFGSLDETLIRVYTRQILVGLQYLHDHNIAHRDIKGANILVDTKGRVKLADFGCSKAFSGISGELFHTMQGTPYWMAPEVMRNEGHGRKADVWSLGCTIIEMATGRPPWSDEFKDAAPFIFAVASTEKIPAIPQQLSADAQDFVRECLNRNAAVRPTVHDLLKHRWVAQDGQPPLSSPDATKQPIAPFPAD